MAHSRPRMTSRSARHAETATGVHKHGFESKAAAVGALRSMSASHIKVYRCIECGRWHHGANPQRRQP